MNSDRTPDSIVFNEDGVFRISKESKQQVLLACLPYYYPTQYLDKENAVIKEFECNNSKYILYAVVKDNIK